MKSLLSILRSAITYSPKNASCQQLRKLFIFIIEDASIWAYLAAFIIIVIIFAIFYTALTPYKMGLEGNLSTEKAFYNSIYFSIVTISSLGYGDIHPLGVSKTLACVEVLFGLGFMGVIVAKITSRRLSYHVEKLFAADAHRRLDLFSIEFKNSRDILFNLIGAFGKLYQETPNKSPETAQLATNETISSFQKSLITLHSASFQFANYFSDETEETNYFSIVPKEALSRVAENANDTIHTLGQLIISLSPVARAAILDFSIRKRISETVEYQERACIHAVEKSKDPEIVKLFSALRMQCAAVQQSYFITPFTEPSANLPDQGLPEADTPEG